MRAWAKHERQRRGVERHRLQFFGSFELVPAVDEDPLVAGPIARRDR
jgi:hypothetical protein